MITSLLRRKIRPASTPPVGDGTPILPQRQPRFATVPPSRNSVPAGQVVRLPSNPTFAQLTAALDTAAGLAATGTAFVLVPSGADITPPVGSSSYAGQRPTTVPNFPVVLAWADWFDGAVTYSTGQTLTRAQALAQPVIRPCRLTNAAFYECDPWLRWTSSLDLVLVGIRCHDDALGNGYTRALIAIGDVTSASLVGDNIGHVASWWCSGGLQQDGSGRPFTAAGVWRYGIGRAHEVNGSGFALRNYYHFGHGAPGSFGSDRGVFAGWNSSGPWFVKGCNFQNPGGIAFIHGGAFQWPGVNCEDVTITQNRFERTHTWNNEHPTLSLVDANGVRCPYAGKNLGETKTATRWDISDNLFLNDFTQGQTAALVWKASWQDSTGRSTGSQDLTFRRNIVTAWNKGALAFSLSESDGVAAATAPQGVDSFQRIAISENIFAIQLGEPSLGASNTARGRLFFAVRDVSFSAPGARRTREPAYLAVQNNLFWAFSSQGPDAPGIMFSGFNTSNPMTGLSWGRNVVGGGLRPSTAPIVEYTYSVPEADTGPLYGVSYFSNPAYFPASTVARDAVVQADTAFVNPVGATPAPAVYATPAAAGLVVTAVDQYSYAAAAALLTADGGQRIGPDLASLMAMRTQVLAGNVTGDPPGGGGITTLAAVDWSTATGSSLSALMDSANPNAFDRAIECSGAISSVMSVVNAAAAGLTAWPTTNALQITALADNFCGNVEWSSLSPQQFPANPNGIVPPQVGNRSPVGASQSHYGCLYFRVEANFFQNHGIAYNAGGTIQMVPIAFNARADTGLPGGGTLGANVQISFKPSFRPGAGGTVDSLGYPYNSWLPGIEGGLGDRFLSLNTTYRYEWYVEYVGALSYRFYPRVFTQFGTVPLFDESTFYPVNAFPAVESLLDWYAAGNLFSMTDAEIARELSFGHEGPFSLNGGGARLWVGRVRLVTGGWPGGA